MGDDGVFDWGLMRCFDRGLKGRGDGQGEALNRESVSGFEGCTRSW